MYKKIIIVSMLVAVSLGNNVFAQQEPNLETSIIFELFNDNFDDYSTKAFLDEVLTSPDVDMIALLSPQLFSKISNFSSRRVFPQTTRSYYNSKLMSLLKIMNENVDRLTNTEGYVNELRYIISDSKNQLVIGEAVEIYAKIILENTPTVSTISGYTPAELFLIDATDLLLSKTLQQKAEEVGQSRYLVTLIIPYVTEVLDQAPSMVEHARFTNNVSLLTIKQNFSIVKPYMKDLVVKMVNLQLTLQE